VLLGKRQEQHNLATATINEMRTINLDASEVRNRPAGIVMFGVVAFLDRNDFKFNAGAKQYPRQAPSYIQTRRHQFVQVAAATVSTTLPPRVVAGGRLPLLFTGTRSAR